MGENPPKFNAKYFSMLKRPDLMSQWSVRLVFLDQDTYIQNSFIQNLLVWLQFLSMLKRLLFNFVYLILSFDVKGRNLNFYFLLTLNKVKASVIICFWNKLKHVLPEFCKRVLLTA